MRKISDSVWWVLLLALILSSCGKLDRTGPKPVNMAPEVFFTNVPEENDSFSTSPLIYWYGTDEDGYIAAYQFAVIRDSTVGLWGGLPAAKDSLQGIGQDSASWIDNTVRLGVYAEHVEASEGHQENVRLYAEMDPTIYTPQYVFLRAVDNKGKVSEIKTRMYWRNNHAPQCSIAVDEDFILRSFYCLPETTNTWKGIDELSWIGLDTLDFPDRRKQPDSYYKWELWGPYANTSNLNDPIATMVDSSLDSIEIGGVWIHDRWTLNKSAVYKNLENYPDSGFGWYYLKVWSRDDAFVVSKEPATSYVRIIKPLFRYEQPSRKTVAVLDHTIYGGAGGADTLTDVLPFYDAALSRIGDLCDDYDIYISSSPGAVPHEDVLSRYDLVIALDLGRFGGISDEIATKYKEYMNVGGRVWLIGMNSYGQFPLRQLNYLGGTARSLGTEYFGVEGVFFPSYSPELAERLEFIAAEPFGSWGFPPLEMDPNEAAKLVTYDSTDSGKNFPENGIPYVTNLIIWTGLDSYRRAPIYRRLYSFVSRRGFNSEMHLMPCATNFIGPTYRTAQFSFPLNLMKKGDEENPGAYEVFRRMVQWLLDDLP